ncbi:MAG: TylF/MycF family methyltransferase [Vicinamibacteria bacterium]
MKRSVANTIYEDSGYRSAAGPPAGFEPEIRAEGLDWPTVAHTMIGVRRLENVRTSVEDVLARDVPGDLIETGVWRGGASIFMRAILKAHEVTDRVVWVADSFRGLPPPNPEKYPKDAGDQHHTVAHLRVSREAVEENFRRYDLLDHQVRFLEGWFRDSLPDAPIERLAVMRLDGDMYESTLDAFVHLYPKLSPGGYVIVDDYGATPACRAAVDDFRRSESIEEPMRWIDWTGVYWRRA